MKNIKKQEIWTNLGLRVFSGFCLSVLALFFTWLGSFYFHFMCSFIAFIMLFEWLRMIGARRKWALILPSFFLMLIIIGLFLGISFQQAFIVFALGGVVCGLESVFSRSNFWPVLGFLYTALSLISLVFIRDFDPYGFQNTLFIFITVWATDSFAYCIGRYIGGPKLAVFISPQKTYSGAIGGIIGAISVTVLFYFFYEDRSIFMLIFQGLLISIAAQSGDLLESWAKRLHHVKDSGNLIPGHGGILDRVDGLSMAGILFYFFFY